MKKIDWLLNLMIVVAAVLLVLSIASLAGKIMRSQAEDEEVREIMAEAQVRIDDYSASKPAQERPAAATEEPVPVVTAEPKPVEDWYIAALPLSKEMQKVAFDAAADNGVDYLLVLAVIGTESCYDSSAVSPSGCYGYMQLNPRYFPSDLDDEENIRDGTAYLADCADKSTFQEESIMLKEFIEHIQRTTQPIIQQIGGSTFVIKGIGGTEELRPSIDHPDCLTLNSLDALVKLVRTEAVHAETPLYITIPDHMTVECFGRPQVDKRYFRQTYYKAKATDVPGFRDGFREQEKAIIELRSRFAPNEGTAYLLDLLSRISKDSAVSSSDNGVSQTVEARQGIALKTNESIKPRVPLRPYRTFQEIEQPESEFLLRLDNDGNVGLFEADGGMWKLKARQTVKAFLEQQLAELVENGSVFVAL